VWDVLGCAGKFRQVRAKLALILDFIFLIFAALDWPARPVRRGHYPIRYNAREGKSGKNGIALNVIAPNNPQIIDERLHSLLSSSSIYHARFLPAGHRSVRH